METPKAGDQYKHGRRIYTVIWAAANHVIYVIDGGEIGHVVSVSEWRKMKMERTPARQAAPDSASPAP